MHDGRVEGIRANPEQFVARCSRGDGGYGPSPDTAYRGRSDTALSDLAAVTYAAVLSRTFGWEIPASNRSAAYIQERQRADGSFAHVGGEMDPESDLAILYNTTQAVVALVALGSRPERSPRGVMDRFFRDGAYRSLPWYTTSFFPLFYLALGESFPEKQRQALQEFMEVNQAENGYLGDHVAATFHMAHFYRLLGEPTPRAEAMVRRTLRDQTPDGGWNFKDPDWDVHACFDAVFILRQLGDGGEEVENAISRAAGWAESCRNPDGGFGHYPGWLSDMDAVYFQLGTLAMAHRLPVQPDLPRPEILGWGHAMPPPAC